MKRLLSILFIALLCTDMVSAQPAARLREQAKKQQQTTQMMILTMLLAFMKEIQFLVSHQWMLSSICYDLN